MYSDVKLTFGLLFKYFPQDKALCSYFAVIPEIRQTACLQFRETQKLWFGSGGTSLLSTLRFLLSMHQHQPIRYSSSS